MNTLQQLEKTLAELLGWTNIFVYTSMQQGVRGDHPTEDLREDLPRWTTDDAAAFQLMVSHKIDILFVQNISVEAVYKYDYKEDNPSEFVVECVSSHPDSPTATRVAIVKAVIEKLKAQNEPE